MPSQIAIAERESSTNRSLERALHILTVMEVAGAPRTLTELATRTSLAKPTVQRLLTVLEKYALVEKRRGRYHLGVAVLPLAHAYLLGNELSRAALPVLQELAGATKETASLFVRLGFQRVVVQRVEGAHPMRYVLPIGQRLPLHAGVGKVLAAALPKEDLTRMLDELGELRRAGGVVVSRSAFLDELRGIRKQGFSISRNEREHGTASVAAPVLEPTGLVVAAVSVAGPTGRLDRATKALVVEVCAAARAISERVGRT